MTEQHIPSMNFTEGTDRLSTRPSNTTSGPPALSKQDGLERTSQIHLPLVAVNGIATDANRRPGADNILYPHIRIRDAVVAAKDFYGSQEGRDYLYDENKKLADALVAVDGFRGVFGVGFPYEAGDANITEISDFLDASAQKVDNDKRAHPEGWACPDCQQRNNLPDLKTLCKPCDVVTLKPRDVFKAIPDIDLFLVVDNPSTRTEQQVEAILHGVGYRQSDTDIAGTIEDSQTVFEAVKADYKPAARLPVDIHIISEAAFRDGMDEMTDGNLNTEKGMASLHMTWENDRIPFGYDYIFSVTPLVVDPELQAAIGMHRKNLKLKYGEDKLMEFVEGVSSKAARFLKDDPVRETFRQRIASW